MYGAFRILLIIIISTENSVPLQTRHALIPCFDADTLRKVEATLEKEKYESGGRTGSRMPNL